MLNNLHLSNQCAKLLQSLLASLCLTALFAAIGIPLNQRAAAQAVSQPALPSPWQQVGEGIAYREFFLSTPNHLYVARLDRSNARATLDSSIAQGALGGGLETVREMAARYDQAINFWGEEWGARNQVVVAINGFFYNPETGFPQSGQVLSGWYARRFDDRQNGSGFAWTLDRQVFIGGCVTHPRGKQIITFLETGAEFQFEALNTPPAATQSTPPAGDDPGLVIYTSQYGPATPARGDPGSAGKRVEVVVQLDRPLMIIPAPAMITGTVHAVWEGAGATPIPFDRIVLSAGGEIAARLRVQARPGSKVGISQELRHFEPDCRTPNPHSWVKTYAGIGASFVFLKDGVIQKFDETAPILRSPRTALAYNDRYIYFIVVDGRDALQSLGMSMVELAVFARNRLGAAWGAALDGGGSSTMIVNGTLKNRPNTEVDDPNIASGQIERAVANGLMMVVVEPAQHSSRFRPGDSVAVTLDALVRLGPGTNYSAFANLSAGSVGAILPHPLNGILAKGLNWWYVSIGGVEGWVSETLLAGAP